MGEPAILSVPVKKVHPNKKLDGSEAVRLALSGWTQRQIAEKYGVTQGAVHEAIGRVLKLLGSPAALEVYRQQKAAIFEELEIRLVQRVLSDLDTGAGSFKDIVTALDVIAKHVRLERGQSTSNIGILIGTLKEAHEDIHEAAGSTI